ncbi:MAG: serine/threonine protein kinase [Oscillospiraceae bacterium]|jgi:serine/threonine-protein kinase|nr:serine/threonine protein kinase [Oscillospiraceae bacterium]
MKWYLRDFYIQYIDGVPLKLKKPFDLEFVHRYGAVFKVFDGQDSGNLCFGVEKDGRRYFVKFAGAPTAEYTGDITGAIERLKAAVPVYQDLTHPSLIRFVDAEKIGGGFAVVFDWVEGICAHPMYPADYQKFNCLPLETRLKIFEDILDFHSFVAEWGYTAVDFYDGSIMYDTANDKTVICDIDFYTKSNAYGSKFLWGHMQSASPEERADGVLIDEISNVYNMGETAFTLFIGRKSDRSRETWPLSDAQFNVAKRAARDDRSERQQSIRQLVEEWRAAG